MCPQGQLSLGEPYRARGRSSPSFGKHAYISRVPGYTGVHAQAPRVSLHEITWGVCLCSGVVTLPHPAARKAGWLLAGCLLPSRATRAAGVRVSGAASRPGRCEPALRAPRTPLPDPQPFPRHDLAGPALHFLFFYVMHLDAPPEHASTFLVTQPTQGHILLQRTMCVRTGSPRFGRATPGPL